MDIGIKCEQGTFKLRACGVVCQDGKILVQKARRFDGFTFMGGHIELGENSRDGVVREIKEELGVDTEIERLICINENIFSPANSDTVAHEIACYYLLKPLQKLPTEDFDRFEIDHGQELTHHFHWIDLESARDCNIRPNWVVDMVIEGVEDYYYLTDQTKNDE